jgi:guanylate kinase
MDQFRYIVVNDEVADAADRLRAVILSQRCLQENCRFTLK